MSESTSGPEHRHIPVPETDDALLAECDVETFRAGGPGGQHQNTTDSAVRLRHRPSGIVVVARNRRSQHNNKQEALARLRDKLEIANRVPTKRTPTRPSRAAERRRIEAKRRRAQKKRERGKRDQDGW